jgi:parallel beta-helix repeat protein
MSCLATQRRVLPAGVTTRLEEGVRVERLSQRAAGRTAKQILLRDAWKLALALGIVGLLLTSRGAEQVQPNPRALANNVLPTNVPCGTIPTDAGDPTTATWTATSSPYGTGSPYILPVNAANNLDTTVTPCAGITVPQGVTLKIDASNGPVDIFSHGAGIVVQGGQLLANGVLNPNGSVNAVSFDAEPDVASWDGIAIHGAGAGPTGDASFIYSSVQHALTAITIDGGATSSPDNDKYGLTLRNSGVVNSYFDGIEATNTPVSLTGQRDGRFGTVNNIGSFGVKVTFDRNAPAPPENALKVDGMTFGSSVPFAETACAPLSPCAAGTIGNDAIQGMFAEGLSQRPSITNSDFFRAGNFGVELTNPNDPIVSSNTFDCNGTGSPDPKHTCTSSVATKSSPIYLNNATADLQTNVNQNFGKEDGLEAIVFNGKVTSSTFTWKTATLDATKELGYVLNGDLDMSGGTFIVRSAAIIKVKGGTLNLSGTTLDATDTTISGTAGAKIFTSLRDNSVGVPAGCSVFVQACTPPLPLPPGDWGGINLVGPGANGAITNASVEYATTGIQILNGQTSTLGSTSFGLLVRGSNIGPTFADGIDATDTPVSVATTTFACPTATCANSSAIRNHGIVADFTGTGPVGAGLKLDTDIFNGTGNEAILGLALSGQTVNGQAVGPQTVSVTGNTISNAGAFGIKLDRASNPTVKGNTVNTSGTGSPTYPAIYLPDLTKGDFVNNIAGNLGAGNGLDALAFHGDTNSNLTWQTIGAGNALGYMIDGNLTVNGTLTLNPNDYVPVLGGAITVKGYPMVADGAVVSSLREQVLHIPSCGSVFVPKRTDGTCQAKAAGDWNGIVLTSGQANVVMNSEIRYATTGITVSAPNTATTSLTLTNTNVRNSSGDGVSTGSTLAISKGAFTNLGGHGIVADLTGDGGTATATVDQATVGVTGSEGILITGDAGHVGVTNTAVDKAGSFGIHLKNTINPAVSTNRVTNTAAGYPAIYLDAIDQADFTTASGIRGNTGGLNPVNALAMHGNVKGGLAWITARTTADPSKPLGFILDGNLNLTDSALTLTAGDIVKISNGGITLAGGRLDASDTSNSSQKIFTSLQDTTIGVPCPTSLSSVSCSAPRGPGQWNGINLTSSATHADGTLINAAIRYATTGISIDSTATSTVASSVYGLMVSRSSISSGTLDGISAQNTAISVTDSTIDHVQAHGISVDLAGVHQVPLRLSGNRLTSTSAEGILGQALAGQPVWIADNHIVGATTFGIRLMSADELVLRNNNVSGSGNGLGGPYPAVYLSNVVADFSRNVRGNVGQGDGLNAIALDGTLRGDLNWLTPVDPTTVGTKPLGYLLDGSLLLDGGNLNVGAGGVVKALGGSITLKGGKVAAAGAAFTSLRDNSNLYFASCPSYFSQSCVPHPGDWGGLIITDSTSTKGAGFLDNTSINWADTGIAIDSGPIGAAPEVAAFSGYPGFRLVVQNGSVISNANKDGINTLDTPISVDTSTVASVGRYGIIASLISPANCASTTQVECSRLTVTGNTITTTARDGIVANGITDQHVDVSDNTVTAAGTYGIHLVGADLDSEVSENTVTWSGFAGPHYPAMYLSNVDGDFSPAGTVYGNRGLNNGLDAVVFHGIAENSLTWVTPGSIAPTVSNPVPLLGYMLDGDLTVNGNFTATGVVKILGGTIKVNGALNSIGTVFTSMDETGAPSACGSVFVPACPNPPTSWGGINVDATASSLSGGEIRNADQGLEISGAPLNVSGVHVSNLNGDAFTVTDSAVTSSFNDMTIDHVNGNGVNLVNSDATFARDVITYITGNGNYAIVSSGGTAAISCTNIHDNANGLSLAGPSTVNDSNAYNNTGIDLIGTSGTPVATGVWYGVANTYTPGKVTGVTVRNLLPSEEPVVSAFDISGTDPTASDTPAVRALSAGASGSGTITETVTLNRAVDPSTQMDVSFSSGPGDGPHDITAAVGGAWNGPTWTTNDFTLDSTPITAGLNHFTASGAKDCIPQSSSNMVPATKDANLAVKPTVVIAGTPAAASYGGSVTLTATVKSNGVGVGGETVEFAIANGSSTVVATASALTDGSGLATTTPISLAGLNVASYGVTAVFDGDNTYAPSQPDTTQTLQINKVLTATTTSASATAVVTGASVTDQAAISGAGATASGTVVYNLYKTGDCSGAAVFTDTTTTFSNGSVPVSAAWTATPADSYNWQASYSGDANHLASTSLCGSDPVVVAAATPTLGTTPSAGAVGDKIHDVANVTGGTTPTGSITFSLYGPGDSTCSTDLVAGSASFHSIVLSGGSAQSPDYTTTQAGTYRWIAHYSGDLNNVPVTGGCGAESVSVTQATPSLPTVPSAGGAVGTAITDTANVTGGYTPSGTITFSLYAPGDSTCAADLLAGSTSFHGVPLSSNSATSPAYTTQHAGDYRWVATYSGDANNSGSTTTCGDEQVTITKATPTVTTLASPAGEVGTTITDTANVSGGANPTGTVSFALYGPGDSTCTTDLLASDNTFHNIALTNGSATTPDYSTTDAGTYHWVATYNGDLDNASTFTACGAEPVTVAQATPDLATVASAGGTVGGAIHDTANLTNGYNPGGDVNFELYAPGDTTCATDLVATNPSFKNIALSSGTAGSPNYTTTLAGDYRWVVDYLGDSNNVSVSSGCGDELVPVAKVSPTISTAVQPVSPVVTGTPVKDQATLTGTTPDAGGDVTYNLYSGTTCTGIPVFTNAQTVTAGSVPLSASFPAQPQGSYTWQAVYSGDSNNNAAVSTCGSDALTVNNALPAVSTVSPADGPAGGGTVVTITGTHLNYATDVNFGTTSASVVVVVSDTQISATSPPGGAGTVVDITVTTPSGTSAAGASDEFTYDP